jgi:hypothetical protein
MTVSAAFALAVMVATLAFVVMVAALSFAVMATAATTLASASQMLDQVLYLLIGGLAVLLDLTCEVQAFAS